MLPGISRYAIHRSDTAANIIILTVKTKLSFTILNCSIEMISYLYCCITNRGRKSGISIFTNYLKFRRGNATSLNDSKRRRGYTVDFQPRVPFHYTRGYYCLTASRHIYRLYCYSITLLNHYSPKVENYNSRG